MQSKLANAVRSSFAKRMGQELPQFRRTTEPEVPPGWVVYACFIASDFTLFIILAISPKEDTFTLELAWSQNGNLPVHSVGVPDNARQGSGACFRLSRLWQEYGFDHWWRLGREITLQDMVNGVPEDSPQTKLAQVESQVEAALEQLCRYGIPYFERVAAERGYTVKLH